MCHNGVIETKLYTSQSEDETNRDTIEQDELLEEEMESDLSTLSPTVGQIVAVHLHGKKQNIAYVYMAMVSFSKLNKAMNKENFD